MDGSLLSIPRSRDKSYLYTLNPSPIHHKTNKIDHHLKIVDFFIQCGCPENFIVEPVLGKYEPDIFYRDKSGKTICVEIQLTPISCKKMQIKLDQFSKEFNKNHDSKTFILCANNEYNKLEIPKGFSFKKYSIPNEISL